MNKKIITVVSLLCSIEDVASVEDALATFGITDPACRPMYYAQQHSPRGDNEPLAAVFLHIKIDDHEPGYYTYMFDASYGIEILGDWDHVQPETFVAFVKLACILKERGRLNSNN